MHQIRILPQKKTVSSDPGLSLMEALMRQGIFLRSDCGGKGSCKKCKVAIQLPDSSFRSVDACQCRVDRDLTLTIPEASLPPAFIMDKATLSFPEAFLAQTNPTAPRLPFGAAVDLGTTTIAIYLCSLSQRQVISSIAIKNPQSMYGADVMSRISAVAENAGYLSSLQHLTVKAIEWGVKKLLGEADAGVDFISKMVVVGNPTMIHLFTGTDPAPIGIAPYQPAFREARCISSKGFGFDMPCFQVQTLPNPGGFLGGDILAAALAADMKHLPDGTLLADLGTNGELMLKHGQGLSATSCATGPAFEGAALSCGIQAVPGAINGVDIDDAGHVTGLSMVGTGSHLKPAGICGAGVVDAVAKFCIRGVVRPDGGFASGLNRYVLVPENPETGQAPIYLSQKDIRSVQLGKSALKTGMAFLLKKAGLVQPKSLIIAGAFGTYLSVADMLRLGMIPDMPQEAIRSAGNLAGAGAVMALCDPSYVDEAVHMADRLQTLDLACDMAFQEAFVENLRFPE